MGIGQGDIITVEGFHNKFLVVSKNAFIKATGIFHACPILENVQRGPIHIQIVGKKKTSGIVICEQIKFLDPSARGCMPVDSIPYETIMDVSDVIQGIFEYD